MAEKESLLKELNDDLLLNDERKQKIIDYYTKDSTYLVSIVQALKSIKEKGSYNIVKATRAGYTTNAIIACLILDKSITVLEPTNMIARDTVEDWE